MHMAALFTTPRTVLLVAALLVALTGTLFTGDLIRTLIPVRNEAMPWLRPLLASLLDIALVVTLVGLAGVGPKRLVAASGIGADPWRPLLAALLVFALVYGAAFVIVGAPFVAEPRELIWGSVGAPLFEEVVYRGLALGLLVRILGFPFWGMIAVPAAVFGVAHLAQGESLGEVLAVVAITGLGGLFFGWLWKVWDWNLWPAIYAHAGLNLMWSLWSLGDSAAGGMTGNLLRAAAVAGLIAVSLWLRPRLYPSMAPGRRGDPA